MHKIQNNILRTLLFKKELRFSELNTGNIPNDHFTFHLKRLIEQDLIEKNKEGLYRLTIAGKEYANRLNTDIEEVEIERQAKIGALIVCVDDFGKKRKYLVQQRLKQPYYGFYGFITGKIKWGETIYEAASREFKEETGLSAELYLAGIEHKMDYSKNGEFLEDKYFYIFKATNPSGELLESFEGGKNTWLSKEEIQKLPDLFDDILKIMDIIEKEKLIFSEEKYNVDRY
ncbi:NUDIX domain-containing protein [Candidatus Atribacteria bacterium MT.SAG.1]|nr:NUDIX domain-containing protein [Candidatus Atribacteria bacterium MT.SAG.1]